MVRRCSTRPLPEPALAHFEDLALRGAKLSPRQALAVEFLAHYGDHADMLMRVDPGRTYAVREPTGHPVEENARDLEPVRG